MKKSTWKRNRNHFLWSKKLPLTTESEEPTLLQSISRWRRQHVVVRSSMRSSVEITIEWNDNNKSIRTRENRLKERQRQRRRRNNSSTVIFTVTTWCRQECRQRYKECEESQKERRKPKSEDKRLFVVRTPFGVRQATKTVSRVFMSKKTSRRTFTFCLLFIGLDRRIFVFLFVERFDSLRFIFCRCRSVNCGLSDFAFHGKKISSVQWFCVITTLLVYVCMSISQHKNSAETLRWASNCKNGKIGKQRIEVK